MKEVYSNLEELVKSNDFMSTLDNDDLYRQILDSISPTGENPHDRSMVEATFQALIQQLAKEEFSNEMVNPYLCVYHVLQALDSIVRDAEDEEKYTKVDLVPTLMDVFYTCTKYGPSSGHIKIAQELLSDWNLRENHISNLRGPEFEKLSTALQGVYRPNTTDSHPDNIKRYKGYYLNFYRDIIRSTIRDDDDDLAANAPYMVDLFLYYLQHMDQETDESVAKIYCYLASDVSEKYSGNRRKMDAYCLDGGKDRIVPHLEELMEMMSKDGFPHHECCEREYKNFLECLLLALKNKVDSALAAIQSYVDILALCNHRLGDKMHDRMGKDITYTFRDIGPELCNKIELNIEELVAQIESAKPENVGQLHYTVEYAVWPKLQIGAAVPEGFKVVCALIKAGGQKDQEFAFKTLKDIKKIKWKDYGTELSETLKVIFDEAIALGDADSWTQRYVRDIAEWIREKAEKGKVLPAINGELIRAAGLSLQDLVKYNVLQYVLNRNMEYIDWKADIDKAIEGFRNLHNTLKEASDLSISEHINFWNTVTDFINQVPLQALEVGKLTDVEFVKGYVDIAELAIEKLGDLGDDEDDEKIIHRLRHILLPGLHFITPCCMDESTSEMFMNLIVRVYEADIDEVSDPWATMLSPVSQAQPSALVPILPKIIDWSLNAPARQAGMFAGILHGIYPHGGDIFHSEMERILGDMRSHDQMWQNCSLMTLQKIAIENPQAFTPVHIRLLSDLQDLDDPVGNSVIYLIKTVAEKQAELCEPVVDKLVDFAYSKRPSNKVFVLQIIGYLGLTSKAQGEQCMNRLFELFPKSDSDHHGLIISNVKDIGALYPALLTPKKEEIIAIREKYPLLAETCDTLIDIIEGRSLAGLSEDLDDQKADLENVKNDVSETGVKVATLSTTVTRHGKDIEYIKEDVTKVEERLDDVEETVEDTVIKVQEVDRKTMTNAPAWSRDVSLLLNPESDHDWRLLAARLGYNNNDIRGWATQHDPCMAVLSEWYATHKTSEATHGVLKALEEMERQDAAEIIRNAKTDADGVVEDDIEETGPLPPIFLSYQWSHQPHVKLLKQHLEGAGYRCWMDTGQMGGGDKLFAKIDSGLRAASVVICCVSEKYSKSDNCNREVNLAVNLGKPIIPLLMEKMPWPPEGSMGPIFSEYLFIRMFQRAVEATEDERFWPTSKFEELLFQLRFYVVPDDSLMTPEYESWWVPKDEVIVIPATKEKDPGQAQKSEPAGEVIEAAPADPRVFLSYQWGKQPQIKALYNRLTSLGYHCWMDIYQMGGGDSLYEKIDRGIRKADVVVCCVTQKYSLSANCKREVSLADATRKPMIPLLLEPMTWPPEGPMSMAFTELLYIGFHKDQDVQMSWSGPQFDELLQKLNIHVPKPMIDGADSKETDPEPIDEEEKSDKPSSAAEEPDDPPPDADEKDETEAGAEDADEPESVVMETEEPESVTREDDEPEPVAMESERKASVTKESDSRPPSAAQNSRPPSAAQNSRPTSAAQNSRPTSAAQNGRPPSAAHKSGKPLERPQAARKIEVQPAPAAVEEPKKSKSCVIL